jgi:UDP-2-acetamido-3-amino-2,3-dideoxy-glucuronate N-acetyltransferase
MRSPVSAPQMTESRVELLVQGVECVELPEISGDNGSLIVAELGAGLPFPVRRMFTLFDIPAGEARGTHAHRECAQFLVCVRGAVTAVVDDGAQRQEVRLDRATLGLHMPAMTWGTQYDYSEDAFLVVLASDPYDAADYIHDYDEFLRLKRVVPGVL